VAPGLRRVTPQVGQRVKVFWFFFSKKNIFLALAPPVATDQDTRMKPATRAGASIGICSVLFRRPAA
jgi:hypothetical protein